MFTMKNLVRSLILTVVVTALLSSLLTGRAAVSNLTIGSYQLISSTRVTRTEFDYIYKASVTNPDTADVSVSPPHLPANHPKQWSSMAISPAASASRKDRCLDGYVHYPPGPQHALQPGRFGVEISGNTRPVANAGRTRPSR